MEIVIIRLMALAFSIVLHEVAHGYAAYRMGDPTAHSEKRLTMNPLAHIDPFGSVLVPLMLTLSNSPVLMGWAKPVPINPSYFRDPRKGMMITALCGPGTNIVLAIIAALLLKLLPTTGVVTLFLFYLCQINVILAVFNMLPIPPLDGSRVVAGLLPHHMVANYMRLERFGMLIIFGLLFLGILDVILWPIADLLLRLLL